MQQLGQIRLVSRSKHRDSATSRQASRQLRRTHLQRDAVMMFRVLPLEPGCLSSCRAGNVSRRCLHYGFVCTVENNSRFYRLSKTCSAQWEHLYEGDIKRGECKIYTGVARHLSSRIFIRVVKLRAWSVLWKHENRDKCNTFTSTPITTRHCTAFHGNDMEMYGTGDRVMEFPHKCQLLGLTTLRQGHTNNRGEEQGK